MSQASTQHVDHVGSLLRPPELREAWFAHEDGKLPAAKLKEVQDKAIRDIVKLQESLGLAWVTDGEFRRGGWSRGFLVAVDGFEFKPSKLTFRNEAGVSTAAPAPVAARKLKRLKPIVADDFRFLKQIASRTPKVTMPTPSHMHFGHFGECFDRAVYKDLDAFFADMIAIYRAEIADLARRGCTVLQLDEVPLTLLCDETNRDIARRQGDDPDKLVDVYIDLINRAIAEKPANMRVVLHLCRGNMQGLWMGDGGYAPIAEKLFNALHVDAYLMEYDSPRAGDFAPLRHLPKGKTAYLGLVSTKKTALESADDLRRKLDEAAKYAPTAQLGLCPQCGFASSAMSKFNVLPNPMTPELQSRKLARLLEVAEKAWGGA
ncbi:MAG: 5-methyltetrahydropteroyltriglutamate--homocysteine S-methyltransferase [Rhodospirillaceae bacterium]|nr:5-methyltetrahydropteroyltriglutamate--homocysteine S-methyltransferase [Rhodospirillaceae bacterium]